MRRIPCVAGQIDNWQRTLDPAERSANRFAAEILIPPEVIREWVESDPSMDAIQAIAAACETSLTSSAVRLMTITTYPAAVVWSQEGKVRWCTPSSSLLRWVRKGRLHEATLATRRAASEGATRCTRRGVVL